MQQAYPHGNHHQESTNNFESIDKNYVLNLIWEMKCDTATEYHHL